MASAELRVEIVQAFAGEVADARTAEEIRATAPSLKTMTAEEFLQSLPAYMLAALDAPMEGDPIPAILIAEIPRRSALVRALPAAQRRVLAKFIATLAGDHELRKGSLLRALTELGPA